MIHIRLAVSRVDYLVKLLNVFFLLSVQALRTEFVWYFDSSVQKRMPKKSVEVRPLIGILYQDLADEVAGLLGYLRLVWECVLTVTDFAVSHLHVIVFERRLSVEEDEDYDSKGPCVHFERVTIVHLSVYDLWR